LTRLELAFLTGREGSGYRWQVPLWRDLVLGEEPERLLEREMDEWRGRMREGGGAGSGL
jgi:hypothetical protein